MTRPRRALLVLLTVTIPAVFAACGKPAPADGAADTTANATATPAGVATTVVRQQTVTAELRALGTVTPRPNHYAELSAPGATRVQHVYVAVGDAVVQGAPLIAFDAAPFDAAAQSADVAQSAAQAAYDRASRLAGQGILPRKAVEQAAADLAQAKATAITAHRASAQAVLRAPIRGVVTKMNAVQGAAVDAPTILVAVADPTAFDVVLALSPDDAATVQVGATVTFYGGDETNAAPIGRGRVSGVGVMLDSSTRTIPVRVRVEESRRPFRAGETITSRVATTTIPGAVTVPQSALVPSGDRMTVFVVDRGIAHAHPVTVGIRADSVAQIVSGLAVGQTIVTSGAFGVQEGSRILTPSAH